MKMKQIVGINMNTKSKKKMIKRTKHRGKRGKNAHSGLRNYLKTPLNH